MNLLLTDMAAFRTKAVACSHRPFQAVSLHYVSACPTVKSVVSDWVLVLQSLWAEYTQELATSSSSANQSFCTDAMVINAPQRHLVDRCVCAQLHGM